MAQARKFELFIDPYIAKTTGVEILAILTARVDEMIE
jgi:hypothetical protein